MSQIEFLNQKYIREHITACRSCRKECGICQGCLPLRYGARLYSGIEDNHEAIIPRELFYKVQEEKARRAAIYKPSAEKKSKTEKSKYSSKYALSDIMVCGECGQPYRSQTWSKYGQKSAVWRFDNRLKNGTKHCKHSPTLKEQPLYEAIMTAIKSVVENQGECGSLPRKCNQSYRKLLHQTYPF